MESGILGTDVVTQIGIIVRDIEKTARDYAEFLGAALAAINPTGTYDKALTQYRQADRGARKARVSASTRTSTLS